MEFLDKFLTSNGFEGFTQCSEKLKNKRECEQREQPLSILGPGE